MAIDADQAAEFLAIRILAQRTFGLLASLQPDPEAFIRSQLELARADVDRINLINDKAEDQRLIRNEAKAILTNLFQITSQKPSSPR